MVSSGLLNELHGLYIDNKNWLQEFTSDISKPCFQPKDKHLIESDRQSTYAPELPLNYQLKADELVTTPSLTHAVVFEPLRLPSMTRSRFEASTSIRRALVRDLPYHVEGSEEFQTLLVMLDRVYKAAELLSVKTFSFIKNIQTSVLFSPEVQPDSDSFVPIGAAPLALTAFLEFFD